MSYESRLDIARRILLTAPPGQFDTFVQDFQTIFAASGESMTDEWVEQVRVEYDKSRTNLATLTLTGTDTPVTTELYERVKEYESSKGSVSAVSVVQEGDASVVRTYCQRIDTSNCHAGSWTAEWRIQSSGTAQGTVTVQTHSYEEGIIQLNTTRYFGPEQGDAVKLIAKWEQEVMDSLAETYDTMGDKLKALRRVMPVTRTRMDWNVLSHRMRKMLGDTKE